MTLLDNLVNGGISGAVNEVTGEPESGGSESFRRFLKAKHVADAGQTNDTVTDDFNRVAEFVVPAQERYRWGIGAAKHEANQGYIYISLVDNTVDNIPIDGSVRLQQRDAQGREIRTVQQLDLEPLRASKSDRTMMVPLPEQTEYRKVGRDSKLALAVESETNTTVDWDNSEVILPTTVYPVSNV